MIRHAASLLLAATLAGTALAGEPAPAKADAATTATAPAADAARKRAFDFLARLQEKNKGVNTLYGEFRQVRSNPMFLDETVSQAKFWYVKPDRFRADYVDEHPSSFWLVGDEMMFYTPDIKQVEKRKMPKGEDSMVNQMLLAFGLDVERIKEFFEVVPSPKAAAEGLIALQFDSLAPRRTFGFTRITITFEEKTLEPRKLFLEEEAGEDTTSIELSKIERNASIDAERFERKFDKDVEILEMDTAAPSFSEK